MQILRPATRTILLAWILALPIVGCEDGVVTAAGDDGGALTLDHLVLCDPDGNAFTLEIDNDFSPLPVGRQWVLEGIEEDEGEEIELRVQITVLDETEVVAGVTTRVVEEAEWEDDELVEVSRNFFAQTEEGTVCYFGEEVDPDEGAWRADDTDSNPGIFMPEDPEVGMVFQQEDAPEARDRAGIVALGESVTVPFGTFDETVIANDCNPVEEPGCDPLEEGDRKVYVEELGIIVDGPAELVEFRPGGIEDDEGDGAEDEEE